ncbi:MAG: hypothetical protein DBX47_05285 [Clostridiales bacterium]|nr:MAG: hypothetical protein DBX47_05285 [Clostridiales bacterium]
MNNKVVLLLVDGMTPDGMKNCKNDYVEELLSNSTYCMKARTVMPSCTLPCHMSLFHSVEPSRHGITTNVYVPQVRPVAGLTELISNAGKKTAFFYTWEELRDLARPGHLCRNICINLYKEDDSDNKITEQAINYIQTEHPDFIFLYLGKTDDSGHTYGWMSQEYLSTVNNAVNCIKKVVNCLPEEYTVIVTADHGGHERSHGEDIAEDMTIPIILHGSPFEKGKELETAQIIDIAPTITKIIGVDVATEWEGRPLV